MQQHVSKHRFCDKDLKANVIGGVCHCKVVIAMKLVLEPGWGNRMGLGIGGPNTARHTGSQTKTSACCLSQLEFAPTIAVTGLSIAGVSRVRVRVRIALLHCC